MESNTSPWALFNLGDDRPWVCSVCYCAYQGLDNNEEQAQFRIGLSDRGAAFLNGAAVIEAEPPQGVTCRHCWRTAK